MDTSRRFFGNLRSLAVFLETETANLQQTHMTSDDDCTEGAVRVLHELHTEVRGLRGQVQDQLACCEVEGKEMRKFMQMCLVLKQRTTEDIQRLKKHFEKYGYKPPVSTQKHSEVKGKEEEDDATGTQDEEEKEAEQEQMKNEEAQELLPSATPAKIPPPASSDPMRTPRLSDFGLSELHFMKAWSNLEKPLGEVPQQARVLEITSQPVQPKTPKCALRMDEEALTPRLEDFGITEHTMCLNNDFTMDLLRKKPSKPCSKVTVCANPEVVQRPDQHEYTPAPASASHSSETSENMDSPETPVLLTPGFKLKKTQAPLSTPLNKDNDSHNPLNPTDRRSTPELPVFETPYILKLLNTVKPSEKDHSTDTAQEEKPHRQENPASSRGPVTSGVWACDIPSLPVRPPQTDEPTPEMPNLETFLGNKFAHRARADWKLPLEKEDAGEQLGLKGDTLPLLEGHDIYTQEWRLSTPPGRAGHTLEPHTPEMPDLSSITQDIFKVLSQCNTKPSAAGNPDLKHAAQPSLRSAGLTADTEGKENRGQY